MKKPLLLATLLLTATLHAGEKSAGPNGGRILPGPKAEFFVTAGRKVQITFLDADGKPTPPSGQTVIVIAGERSAPTKLTFVSSGEALVSEQPLPEGPSFPAVVQIKPSPDAPAVTEKFNLNLAACPACKLGEYACICSH